MKVITFHKKSVATIVRIDIPILTDLADECSEVASGTSMQEYDYRVANISEALSMQYCAVDFNTRQQ